MRGELWLVRHGDTEWTVTGQHTSRTEVHLTDGGRAAASALAPHLAAHRFALVLTSPRERARETAARAGFPDAAIGPDLRQWDYRRLEGQSRHAIRRRGAG